MQTRNKDDKQQALRLLKSIPHKLTSKSSTEIDNLYKNTLQTGNYNDVKIIDINEQNRLSNLILQDVIKLVDNYDKMTLGKLNENNSTDSMWIYSIHSFK